ncbi:MAG: hypothetical protein HJJLKODD_02687 [Phycisphaerae bacterium]|nr:hypothetical protein [Phycisphaerae bacterium]
MQQILSLQTRIIRVVLLPMCFFLLLSAIYFHENWREYQKTQAVQRNSVLLVANSQLVNEVQRERGKSAIFLNGATELSDLQQQQSKVDEQLKNWNTALRTSTLTAAQTQSIIQSMGELSGLRSQVTSKSLNSAESSQRYSGKIDDLLNMAAQVSILPSTDEIAREYGSLVLLESAKESTGILRA